MGRKANALEMTRQDLLRTFTAGAGALAAATALGMSRALAQSAAPAATPAETGTRLILLGTAGGPIIRKFRSEPSNLLVVDGRPYMIDCGAGCLRQLAWAGYKSSDLAAVFITHHHLDHDADLANIIAFDWIQGRKAKLPIYGPYGTKQMTAGALEYFAVPERVFGKEAKFSIPASQFVDPHDIKGPGVIYTDDKIKVTAAENTHYNTFDAGPDKSYSYRFDTATRSIVFSGDTGPSDALIALAKDADVLVSEVIDAELTISQAPGNHQFSDADAKKLADHMRFEHLAPEEVGKIAARANVKMVVLTHIAPSDGSVPDAAHYTAGVKRFYNGPVVAGQDLLEI
jgi:ribonuclease BN (tRNA processing enzyme)